LDAEADFNTDLEAITENIKLPETVLGYYELKKHKPLFDKGCSKLLDQRRQVKLQWLQDPSEINGNNLNVRREATRHFKNKKREYLKGKISELATNSTNTHIRDLSRGINELKTSYQPKSNLVKDENGDLLADSHNIIFYITYINSVRTSQERQYISVL
jgi:hypothetical protein